MYHEDYWKQFEPSPSYWYTIYSVLYTVIGVLGVGGNIIVLRVCEKKRSNYFVLNLAIADSIYLLHNIPVSVYNCFKNEWAFGEIICNIHGWLAALAGFVSISTVTFISIEKCIKIRKPLLALEYSKMFTKTSLICAWFYGLIWSLLPFLGPNNYVLEGMQTSCTFDYLNKTLRVRAIVIAMIFGGFLIPICIIILSYKIIITKLRKREVHMPNSGELGRSNKYVKSEIKAVHNAILITTLFCLTWLPYLIMVLIAQFANHREYYINSYTTSLPAIWAKTSSIVNPLVYGLVNGKFTSKHLFSLRSSENREKSLRIKCTLQENFLLSPEQNNIELANMSKTSRKQTVIRNTKL